MLEKIIKVQCNKDGEFLIQVDGLSIWYNLRKRSTDICDDNVIHTIGILHVVPIKATRFGKLEHGCLFADNLGNIGIKIGANKVVILEDCANTLKPDIMLGELIFEAVGTLFLPLEPTQLVYSNNTVKRALLKKKILELIHDLKQTPAN